MEMKEHRYRAILYDICHCILMILLSYNFSNFFGGYTTLLVEA